MIKNLLFAGKDFPSGEQYYSKTQDMGITPLITKNQSDQETNGNPHLLTWNKGSIISAHSLVLQAENLAVTLDAACLIFDCPHLSTLYSETDNNSIQAITVDLILSYQILSKTLMNRFIAKKHGKLVFVLKPSITNLEAVKKNTSNTSETGMIGPSLSSAQSAFETFAENFSVTYADSAPDKIRLIKAGTENDAEIAEFICQKLLEEEDKGSKRKTVKDTVKWITVSGKEERAFAFFKRF